MAESSKHPRSHFVDITQFDVHAVKLLQPPLVTHAKQTLP